MDLIWFPVIMNNAALTLFLSSGMSVPLFAKKVLFPMNVKSPNQNFLTFRLTTIKMQADFKRKSNRIATRQLDTTHKRIATRQTRQYLITLLSALYIYWSTLLKLGSRLLQVEYMWRTLFLCIFKLTCSLFRLTCWFVKLSLFAAFLHIWQQANRKFIQRTFYKLLIKRLLCLSEYTVCTFPSSLLVALFQTLSGLTKRFLVQEVLQR